MRVYSLAFLILNLGAEMIFILNTRLIAQQVRNDIARTVLNDVMRHMFSKEFMDELFHPQSLYTYAALKEVFTSLMQTSMMRLSPLSMGKLFDLMTMAVKYQVFTLRHPFELLEFTWKHLEEVQGIIVPEGERYLSPVFTQLGQLCAELNAGDLADIRREILTFLTGRRISVSVLLDLGFQTATGSFCLPKDYFLPPLVACEPPGSIRYYSNGKLTTSRRFDHRDAALCHPSFISLGTWNPQNLSRSPSTQRLTRNGTNMYAVSSGESKGRKSLTSQPEYGKAETLKALTMELNHLSELVRGTQRAPEPGFKLSLFDDLDEERDYPCDALNMNTDDGNGKAQSDTRHDTAPAGTVDKKDIHVQNSELFRIVDGLGLDAARQGAAQRGTGGSLLDIMDED